MERVERPVSGLGWLSVIMAVLSSGILTQQLAEGPPEFHESKGRGRGVLNDEKSSYVLLDVPARELGYFAGQYV